MVAIVSLLNAQDSDKVNQLIFSLEREFGLKGVQMTPYPHLTLVTVNDGSLPNLKEILGKTSGVCCRLKVTTTGLGIFTGEKPILYIPILRTADLNHFHAQLHREVSLVCQEVGPLYHPNLWMPHLSLALGDTTPEVVAQALLFLSRENFNWQVELDNLALLTKHGDLFLKDDVFPLVGEEAKASVPFSAGKVRL
ncbi:2'-5' RNA ligase family protein [Rufibacter glacialis]|uniref:2'-5' RNA ligase family protein n=1 Tax=Rufibacter glacialis TaxID=1259555 RepID=A0A5M8QK17_9BACT|nr:2'-5' RNA ligase family protein [Rufibacter glacialis]KAA6434652.1 2'-5' RNA ligase family protein [Rufibacter glacialis]GGK71374.1 hypothetical protein GCM10011405_19410 [Rufibacter glacialis]